MHLVRRFFGFLTATPLSPGEQQQVRDLLRPALARLFFAQRREDQRHAFNVQQSVGGTDDIAEAALLHDVGKTHSGLGAFSRSLATLCNGIGLPTRGHWKTYLDHGNIGADMLTEADASELAISFTRHHPGPPPVGVSQEAWHALEEADNA